ncbi:Splicing factor 3B subunit 4 [Thelohanellus kitauei]|nr:Splicing factor 3B subunit 4 [Thelohanellus kitauei]
MGTSKGFAFINYGTFEASDAAIEAMNGQFLCNRPITVSYAYKKDSRGERHGSAAERILAMQNPLSLQDKPHQKFADAPPNPTGPAPPTKMPFPPGVSPHSAPYMSAQSQSEPHNLSTFPGIPPMGQMPPPPMGHMPPPPMGHMHPPPMGQMPPPPMGHMPPPPMGHMPPPPMGQMPPPPFQAGGAHPMQPYGYPPAHDGRRINPYPPQPPLPPN